MHWRDQLDEVHPTLREAVLSRCVERRYEVEEALCREGGPPDAMFLIDSGRVLVQAHTVDGAAVGLNVVDTGGVVGEMALLADEPRAATVIAVRETRVHLLRPRAFQELRGEHPQIDQFLVRVLDRRLRELSARFAEAVHSTAEERVCRRLTALGSAFDGTIRLSQARLASLAGTTRPTVNRVLQDLTKADIVRLRRARVEVIDIDALESRIRTL